MFEWLPEYESVDDIPEQYRTLYRESDGKFHLDGGLADKLSKGAGAHTTLAKVRKEKTDAERALRELRAAAGVDTPEELTSRLTDLEEKATKSSGADDRVNQVRADLEKTYGTKVTTLETELANERATNDRDYLDNQIADAVMASEAIPMAMKPLLRQSAKVVRDGTQRRIVILDENGEEVLDGHGNAITVRGYVDKLKQKDEFGFAFKPRNANGGGTGTGNGGKGTPGPNPFAKESRNLTEAQNMIRDQPDKARQLAKQAGYPVTW